MSNIRIDEKGNLFIAGVWTTVDAEQFAKEILARVAEARESRVERLAERLHSVYTMSGCDFRAAARAAIAFLEGGEK
jgi:hypothetical protein